MKVGIVGKPNVGKSSFFRALTLAKAESANYPFTTIDANFGIGYLKVKDPALEFGKRSNPREGYVLGDYRFVPVEVVDVAGLVPGAHEGKGLGNKFLDDLRQANVLIHVIDLSGSTNDKGEPVPLGSYDPANDIIFLGEELNHWFYNIMRRNLDNVKKKIKFNELKLEEAFAEVLSGLMITKEHMEVAINKVGMRLEDLDDKLFDLAKELRRISKPIIVAANKVDLLLPSKWKSIIEELRRAFPDYTIVPVMAEYELNLKMAHEKGFINYIPGESSFEVIAEEKLSPAQLRGLEKMRRGLMEVGSTGVSDVLNKAVFDILKYKAIFPGGVSKLEDSQGNVLPDCFLMPPEATALDFAYRLHSDFGKHFIKAINVRTKMSMGKDHILSHCDIVEIVSGK